MTTHWKECHGIEMHKEVKPYEVQNTPAEPIPRLPELVNWPKQVSNLVSRGMSREKDQKLSKQLAKLSEQDSSESVH